MHDTCQCCHVKMGDAEVVHLASQAIGGEVFTFCRQCAPELVMVEFEGERVRVRLNLFSDESPEVVR